MRQPDPKVVQMQKRIMQTRTYVNCDAKKVMKEVLAVLQDEGYMVKNISHDLGVITAERNFNIEKFGSKFWAYITPGKSRWKKHTVIELTTHISEKENRVDLRVNFLVRIFDNYGRVVDVYPVLEERAYKDFFNKMQAGILAIQI